MMNFSKGFIRSISLVLMILILIPAMPSYAKAFKDVPTSHWAYSYVDKMSNMGYIKGDPDGSYRPKDSLTYLETLSLISRLLVISDTEKTEVESFRSVAKKYGVAEWAQEAVMKCLYKGIVSESELKLASDNGMIKVGTKTVPSRLTISVYLAKAMGLEEIANKKPFVALSYKDLLKIDSKYHKILFTLIEAGVLDPNGTGNGNFEPIAKIQRDAMAKMMSTAYDYLQKSPQVPPTPIDTEVIKGTLVNITPYGVNTHFITIKDRLSKDNAFLVDSSTTITLDNKPTNFSSLFVGQEVELSYQRGKNTAISIKSTSVEEELNGFIKGVYTSTNKLVIEYTEDKTNKTAELTVDINADIILNGKAVYLKDLKVSDKVNVISKNNIVSEIEAISKSSKVEGFITDIRRDNKTSNTRYFITIQNDKDIKTEYEVDEDAYIYRNRKSSRFDDLRVLDEVYVELEYDLIVDIEADIVEKKISGQIIRIIDELNQRLKITILNPKTNKEETYTLSKDAKITIDKSSSTSFDLRKGYYVDAVIGSDEIIEINANSIASQSLVRGKIKYLNTKNGEIDLEVYSSDISSLTYGDVIFVRTSKDIEVRDGRSYYYDITVLSKGDQIDVYGYYDGYTFLANEINIR